MDTEVRDLWPAWLTHEELEVHLQMASASLADLLAHGWESMATRQYLLALLIEWERRDCLGDEDDEEDEDD